MLAARIAAAGALLCAAMPVAAQSWQAVVIGQSGLTAPRAFGDSFHVAEALKLGGVETVDLLRDKPRDEVMTALGTLKQAERGVIYLSGPLLPDGNGIKLADGPLLFDTLMAQLEQGALQEVALLIETCPSQGAAFAAPVPPAGIATLRAASVAPGAACSDAPRMTDLLIEKPTRAVTLNEMLAPVWVSSDLTAPLTLRPPPKTQPVVSIVQNEMVSLAPVQAVATEVAAVTRVALQQPATPRPAAGEVVIFSPTSQAQLAALPTEAGLPEPSIIIGLIEGANDATFEQVSAPSDVGVTEISFESLEARVAMRAQDPEQFAQLVSSGAFDPPEQLLAAALQTELTRMKCYTSTIDGIWGRGSRTSVENYFGQIDGTDAVSLEPTSELFRQIITQDDVDCPVVAAVARTPRTNSTTRARATTSRTAAKPRAAAKPRTTTRKPATTTKKRKISTGTSLGVFR